MKIHIIAAITIMLVCSCNRKPKDKDPPLAPTELTTDTVVAKKIPRAVNSVRYLGLYKGNLPCAGCKNVETTLELAEDFTYSLKRRHVNKNEKPTEQTGTYSWTKDETAILLDNIVDAPNEFLVGENSLMQVSNSGEMPDDIAASDFVLKKMSEAEVLKRDAHTPQALYKK
ncbi:MAG: copper resistance protein NlpE N-terminal domain-containing protein [Flavisolibacter sp.]|nr:copper resistance protein NlpE N-terminal domain-containing protein [Flavisolibacter sp.]